MREPCGLSRLLDDIEVVEAEIARIKREIERLKGKDRKLPTIDLEAVRGASA